MIEHKFPGTFRYATNALQAEHIASVCEYRTQMESLLHALELGSSEKLAALLRKFCELSARIRQYDTTALELGIDWTAAPLRA